MELPEGKPGKGKAGSGKQWLMIGGTVVLVVLAWLQLRKMNGSATQASTTPAASYSPASDGGPVSGVAPVAASPDVFKVLSDSLTSLVQGVSQQAQDNQALVQGQLQGLADQQSAASESETAISGALTVLASKVTDLTGVVGNTAGSLIPHPVSVPSGEHPAEVPAPVVVPNAGPGKVTASKRVVVNAGDSWDTISAKTGESLAQLRSNGNKLSALKPGTITVKV